jgi:CRISPR-associated protein Csx10
VVTDALPVAQTSGHRCFPVPRTLKRAKRPGVDVPLQFYGLNTDLDSHPQMTGVTGFVADLAEGDPELVHGLVHTEVPVELRAHAVIDDDQQRPTSQSGGLYIQEAISPGVRFRAEVWSTTPTPSTDRPEEYLVGRSKKDDYGLVELTISPADESLEPMSTSRESEDGYITMRLLSDLLVRDPLTGEFTTVPDRIAASIAQQWGLAGLTCDLARTHLAVNAIDSWHVRWGLPRPTLLALTAGSVITLSSTSAIDHSILITAEKRGVGDRRAEGFGRVRFNDPLVELSADRCLDVIQVSCMAAEGGE